jgi:hypothetical protein
MKNHKADEGGVGAVKSKIGLERLLEVNNCAEIAAL